MWSRKNFFISALFLNCVYFVGVSVLVTRHFSSQDQSALIAWVDEGSQLVTKKFVLDSNRKQTLLDELQSTKSEKKIKAWADAHNIVNLAESINEVDKNHIGDRNNIPFKRAQLRGENSVAGFHRKNDRLNFSYFLRNENMALLATQQTNDTALKMQLDAYDLGLLVAETEGANFPFTLYTNLTKTVAEGIFQQISFDAKEFSPKYFTLAGEKYLVKMVNLIHDSELKQKMIFAKKITHYQAVSILDILVFVWTFFLISIVLNFVLFRSSRLTAL